MTAINLFLDDVRNPPGDGWTVARSAEEAWAMLRTGNVEACSLDHDLGECAACASASVKVTCRHKSTGYDLVKWMAEHNIWPRQKPTVHSANPAGAASMRATIDRYWTPSQPTGDVDENQALRANITTIVGWLVTRNIYRGAPSEVREAVERIAALIVGCEAAPSPGVSEPAPDCDQDPQVACSLLCGGGR